MPFVTSQGRNKQPLTHMSIPFIHNPRYLNLLPPHPGKLLSASSRDVFSRLFPCVFFAQRSGPSRLCFSRSCCCLLGKQKRNQTSGFLLSAGDDRLKDGACVRAPQKGDRLVLRWAVFALEGDSRKRGNKCTTGSRADRVNWNVSGRPVAI